MKYMQIDFLQPIYTLTFSNGPWCRFFSRSLHHRRRGRTYGFICITQAAHTKEREGQSHRQGTEKKQDHIQTKAGSWMNRCSSSWSLECSRCSSQVSAESSEATSYTCSNVETSTLLSVLPECHVYLQPQRSPRKRRQRLTLQHLFSTTPWAQISAEL